MNNKKLKEVLIVLAIVIVSFILDLIIAKLMNLPNKTPILIHGSLYLLYSAAIFTTKFAFYSKGRVESFMTNFEKNEKEEFKLKIAIYAIIAGFLLISLEGLV